MPTLYTESLGLDFQLCRESSMGGSPVKPTPSEIEKEQDQKFKVFHGYIGSLRTAWAT